ncbi:MAG: hypothetical protein WCV88_01150 [Patescibacteria group bacterium]
MPSLISYLFIILATVSNFFGGLTQPNYNATLSAIQWNDGVPLIMIHSNDKLDIFSGDGKMHTTYKSDSSTEFLSPQKLLVGDTGLYYITPEGSQLIEQSADRTYQYLSLSPQQDFLEYNPVDSSIHCISTFDFQTLGPCVDVTALLSQKFDWNTEAYIDTFWDSNWDKTHDQYIIRVRSKLLYDLLPSGSENMPPVQVQRELARFSYDPNTQTVQTLSLDQPIMLKTPDIFITASDQPLLEYFQPGADITITSNPFNQSVGIAQRSTNTRAKLTDVSFFDDMPGFSVVTYKQ